jgi:hypothetical protein
MSCNRYKKALIEAAALGDRWPTAAAGDHLASCDHCQKLLAREQALFAAIDTTVQGIANVEAPPTLLEGMQARLVHEYQARRPAIPAWGYAFAAASLMLIIFAANDWLQVSHRFRDQATPVAVPDKDPLAVQQSNRPTHPASSHPDSQFQTVAPTPSRPAPRNPEVLVQPGEEAQLVRFYEAMRAQPYAMSTVSAQENDVPVKPLAIAPIEIARLEPTNFAERRDVNR